MTPNPEMPSATGGAFRGLGRARTNTSLVLYSLCLSPDVGANIGVIQIYRTAPWLGIVALAVAIMVESVVLGKILQLRSPDESIGDRALLTMLVSNLVCFFLGFTFPNLTSADLASYLGTRGALGTHLTGFAILWVAFSTVVKAPIALFFLKGRYESPVWIVVGVMAATIASSLVLMAGILTLRIWY